MKIDLFKLNNFNSISLDDNIEIPSEYFGTTGIKRLDDLHITGQLFLDDLDELSINALVSGTMILTCARSLEDVPYPFTVNIEEILGNFGDFYTKNKNTLDILPIIWENIVSEVPMRVVKDGIELENLRGDGWELSSSEE